MRLPALLDDRSGTPLRSVIGSLLAQADLADFAIGHVRLGAIDLSLQEISRVQRCRLLLDRLDVEMLSEATDAASLGGTLQRNLTLLHEFSLSGRIELRSSGSLKWFPDFSIVRGLPPSFARTGSVCLLGAHYFARPVMLDGASFTCVISSRRAVTTAQRRFDELWDSAHDVLPVVQQMLARVAFAVPTASPDA